MTDLPTDFQDNVGDVVGAAWHNAVGAAINANTAAIASLSKGPVPPESGWSNINIGTDSGATDNGHQLLSVAGNTGVNTILRVRALSPASTYTATFFVDPISPPNAAGSRWLYGTCLRQSSGGKIITFGTGDISTSVSSPSISAGQWVGPTAHSTWPQQANADLRPSWWRIKDTGTNHVFSYSHNGLDWVAVHSQSRTAYLTADEIGFFCWNGLGSGIPMAVRLRSFTITDDS